MSDDLVQAPAAFTDPRVRCHSGFCKNRATVVVYVQEPERLGAAEPWALLRCDLLACRMDCPDGEVLDTTPVTRELAQRITGLDLSTPPVLSTAQRLDGLFPEDRAS